MYQEVLRSVEGIGIFPAVSLVVFVTVFTAVVWRAVRMDVAGVRHMAALPLEDHSREVTPRPPYRVPRSPLRRLAPFAWLARGSRSLTRRTFDEPGQ